MWLLLVAAGSGYIVRCCQNVLRAGQFALAEIDEQKRLLKTSDELQLKSLEGAATAGTAETQLAVVDDPSNYPELPALAQLDPVSKPSGSPQEETDGLEGLPKLVAYVTTDQSLDIGSGAAQVPGEQAGRDVGVMDDGELPRAGACSYTDENLLHRIRLKRRKLFHRTVDLSLSMDSVVHVGSDAGPVDVGTREATLLRCGVAIGVMLASKSTTSEIQRLQQQLKEAQARLEVTICEAQRYGNCVPEAEHILQAGEELEEPNQKHRAEFSLRTYRDVEGTQSGEEFVDNLLREDASSLPAEQMAELEAELEAELQHLAGQFSDVDEDGIAAMVQGDLNIRGLPAQVDPDEDDDSDSEVTCINNYVVSPRELTQRLYKLQEELISKLETDLELAETQLQLKEEELEQWKKHVLRLNELSFCSPIPGEDLSMHTGSAFTPFEKSSPSNDSITKIGAVMHGCTVPGGAQDVHLEPSDPSSVSLLDAQYGMHEGLTRGDSSKVSTRLHGEPDSMMAAVSKSTFSESPEQEGHPGVDRRLDFGDALETLRANDEVCDEFLQAMVDGGVETPAWHELDRQASSEFKLAAFDDLQAEYLKPKTSNLRSIYPSIPDFFDAVSTLDDWASRSDSATGQQVGTRGELQNASEISDQITAALDGRPGKMTMAISEVADREPREYMKTGTTWSSAKYIDPSIKSLTASNHNTTTYFWNRDSGLGHAGVNTPVDSHYSRKQPLLSTWSKGQELEWASEKSSPRVADRIIFWDGLSRREPLLGMRADWECQSQASDYEQQLGNQEYSNAESTSCCKDSLVTDAEKYLGNWPETIVPERIKHGLEVPEISSEACAMLNARPRGHTSREEAGRVQSGRLVKAAPRKLGAKDGIEAEEAEYEFLSRRLQQLGT